MWCRYHGAARDVRCRQADCRAEEIRLTLWRRNTRTERPVRSRSVYSGCSLAAVERLWDHIDAMNGLHPGRREWGHRGQCAVCVTPGDKRSIYLPRCTEAQAACRGLYYAPAHNYSATTPLVCAADLSLPLNISVTRGDDWGCPSNTDDFLYSNTYYP